MPARRIDAAERRARLAVRHRLVPSRRTDDVVDDRGRPRRAALQRPGHGLPVRARPDGESVARRRREGALRRPDADAPPRDAPHAVGRRAARRPAGARRGDRRPAPRPAPQSLPPLCPAPASPIPTPGSRPAAPPCSTRWPTARSTARDVGRRLPELALPLPIGTGRQATTAGRAHPAAARARLRRRRRARPADRHLDQRPVPVGRRRRVGARRDRRRARQARRGGRARAALAALLRPGDAGRPAVVGGLDGRDDDPRARDVGAVEVELDDGVGFVLPDDLDPVDPPEPWVALLPGLDPTTMGWKQRGWYLDPEVGAAVFDRNGNGGPTVWVDGRIVGELGPAPRRDDRGAAAHRRRRRAARPRSTPRPPACRSCSATSGSPSASPHPCRPRCSRRSDPSG